MARITIDSILGGQSQTTHYAAKDQFKVAIGIDPSQPDGTTTGSYATSRSSGLLRPTLVSSVSNTTLVGSPLWIVNNPKTGYQFFVYDATGSAYTHAKGTFNALTALSDGGSLSNSTGNGAAYYDNYVYFAKDTTVARYGPLDGSTTIGFDGDYWVTTLAKTALGIQDSPFTSQTDVYYPNHVMHRHSDGRLYFADVTNNQGVIHYISTKKTTYEGDTNNGSTYAALTLGYGQYVTAIESYGSGLVLAVWEGSGGTYSSRNPAKLVFWDTTSQNFNSITNNEFPDPYISALKNINGVLYIFSGNPPNVGFRVSRYIGGSSIQDVHYSVEGEAPFPGAVDGLANTLYFGSFTDFPTSDTPCVYAINTPNSGVGKGIYIPYTTTPGTNVTTSSVTALRVSAENFNEMGLLIGTGGSTKALDKTGVTASGTTDYSVTPHIYWSQLYNIGQPFQIKRIRVPLVKTLSSTMTIVPKLYFDNGAQSQTLTTINSTNFPTTGPGNGLVANIRTAGDGSNIIIGQQNFWLELKWTGTGLATVDLPIIIDFDIIPD